jgi:hypothetical protein
LQTLLAIETIHTASFALKFLVEAIILRFGSLLRDEVARPVGCNVGHVLVLLFLSKAALMVYRYRVAVNTADASVIL